MDSEGNFDCFICHAHATGFHFGAQSCQACCAFFRRAVSLKRQYICQQKRKSGSNAKEFDKNGENEESENSSKQKILCRSCRFQKCLSVGMNPNNVQTPQKTNINAKNGRNYFTKSGLERNKKFAKGALKPFTREDIKPLSFQEFRRSIRTHILLVYEWLRVWPAFSDLNMKDRVTLLRKCVLYHTVLDPCFLTIQMGDLEKFVLPNGGYVSTKFPPLDEALPDISFTGRALVSRELDSLCSSLYKFYGSQTEFNSNQLEKAERFGNLILLLTPIIDTANTFVESHHIVQFFDLWQMDSLMLQFLQNKSS
uniref:Nuclear receptor n=1 Tax=Meloidogyne javanica TaxID=6303 RepID=A0A915MFS4_MELJA